MKKQNITPGHESSKNVFVRTIRNKNIVLLFVFFVSFRFSGISQNIGINTTGATPNSRAILDIDQPGRGLLIPRMVKADRDTITSIPTSLLIYQTDNNPGYYYYNGTAWVPLLTNSTTNGGWALTGNAGTAWNTNFLGTTDNVSLRFRTNNTEKMIIDSTGKVGIGITNPTSLLDIRSPTADAVINLQGAGGLGGIPRMLWYEGADNIAMMATDGSGVNPANFWGIWMNGVWRFAINRSTGNVAIGASFVNAQSPLHVLGRIQTGYAGNARGEILLNPGASVPPANNFTIYNEGGLKFAEGIYGSHTDVVTITGTYRVGIGTGIPGGQFELSLDQGRKPSTNTWTIVSDTRLKNIEGNYNKGLKEILQLQPIAYYYKNAEERTFKEEVLRALNVGFSAQDVQKIFPEAVGTDDDGYLNFNMHSILVAYVNAFKEQQMMIDSLKLVISKMQEENTTLKAANDKQQTTNTELKAEIEKIKQYLELKTNNE